MSFCRNPISNTLDLARYGRVAALAAMAIGTSASACGTHSESTDKASVQLPVFQPDLPVALARGAHPWARPEFDRGPLDPNRILSNLSVAFRLTPAQIADRNALIEAQQNPGSPSYHRWLTPEKYAARFGATADTIARTRAWLAQQGLQVMDTSPLGSRVTFSGRVADLQSAFHAPIHRYEVGGEMHYATATAPSVPASLADVVLGIHNLHDFFPRPMVKPGSLKAPAYKNGFQLGFGPTDWANVYDVSKLYTQGVSGTPIDGAGATIAIVGIAEVGLSDINQFRTKFGLPQASTSTWVSTLVPNTGAATPGAGTQEPGSGVEAYLDNEWSGGLAPGATVYYVFTGYDDANVDDATYYAIENNLAGILSESWGGCEEGLTPADADLVGLYGSAAELLGITYLASSGDSGAETCIGQGASGLYVDTPASDPSVTGVGGSEFPSGTITYSSAGIAQGYSTSEECWNEGNNPPNVGAGGGGISVVFARPTYQAATPTCTMLGTLPTSVNPANMRMVPDIVVNAASNNNPDFIMCTDSGGDCGVNGTNDSLFAVGGTSAAAPAFAGVVALLTQAAGGGRLGNINPLLYQLSASSPSSFHDIVNGNNEVVCTPGTDTGCPTGGLMGFPATTGYDCATGIGSPDVFNLATTMAGLAPTSVSLGLVPTTSTPGGMVNMTATVDVTKPNASALGGTVRFTFQSYQGGSPDLTWTLGTDTVTAGTPATSSGTATFSGAVPVGLVDPAAQYVDVVAMYGGDAHHLASTSAKVRLTFQTTTSFCLVPSYGTIQPEEGFTFSSTGGTPPVQWYTGSDSTCDQNGNCSTIDVNSGAFRAGPEAGYVVVVGIDANGVEQVANLVVGDPGDDAGTAPWGDAEAPFGGCNALPPDAGFTIGAPEAGVDAGPMLDSGVTVIVDSGTASTMDSGVADDGGVVTPVDAASDAPVADSSDDAGASGGGTAKSGCGCKVVARGSNAPAGAFGGIGLGLGALLRRRRRAPLLRSRPSV